MPSLRRSLSASPRSSPYRATVFNANNGGRARGHGPRRPSGSETSGRRVLADIEWWRVMDGQRELEIPESEHREHDENQPNQIPVAEPSLPALDLSFSDAGHSLPSSSFSWSTSVPSSPEMLPTQFSGLAITPTTPPRRRHSRQSSASSLDSLPESPVFSGESLSFGLADFDFSFEDTGSSPALPTLPYRRLRPVSLNFDLYFNSRDNVSGTPMDGIDFSLN